MLARRPRSFTAQVPSWRLALLPLAALLAGGACASEAPPAVAPPRAAATVTCPAPVGAIPREDCAEVGAEFGELAVGGALKNAGTSAGAEPRIQAIRAAQGLANALKEERVKLCEDYDACRVSVKDHAERDGELTALMRSLIELWNARRLSTPAEAARLHAQVAALDKKLHGDAAPAGGEAAPPRRLKAGDAFAAIPAAEIAYRADTDGIRISTQDAAAHDAMRARADLLPLVAGGHYRVKVLGTYAPAAPPLILPGDELIARLKFRADAAGDLNVALRSLEDPDATEATVSWHVAAGEKGAHETPLTASPEQTGFYLAVSWKGDGPIDLDDVELVRGAQVLASARAEAEGEPDVKVSCAAVTAHAIAGKRSLRCDSGADKVTLGMPAGHLYIAVREGAADRVVVHTLSLQGGRSLEATLQHDAQLVIGLAGPGSATIQRVEVTELHAR